MRLWRALARCLLLAISWITANGGCSLPATAQEYALLSGSELTDDCPICDRIPIVVPLTGTFRLSVEDSNPLFTSFAVTNISFRGGRETGPQYDVTGSGTYRVGGEVAVLQEMYLEAAIKSAFTNTPAALVNKKYGVERPWPGIQISVDQTNGTLAQVYYLTLNAVPVPAIRSIVANPVSGDVQLEWENYGATVQLERAPGPAGPYAPVSPATTDSSYTDLGAASKYDELFYRVRLL